MWVLSPYQLPCGLVSVDLPHAWDLEKEEFYAAEFGCEEGRISLRCMAYERPDLIESGRFEELFWDFLDKKHFEQWRSHLAQWWAQTDGTSIILSEQEQAQDGEWYRHVWRVMRLRRPHHVRRLTWRFEPEPHIYGKALRAFTEELHEVVIPRSHFAEELTALDRVGPSPSFKMISLADSVFMRVPPQWKLDRENADGSGRYVIDEPEHDRWTLWLDWYQLSNQDDPDAPFMTEGFAANLGGDTAETVTDEGDKVIIHTYPDSEEPPNRITAWHRFGRRGGYVVVAHFSFVVEEADADLPEFLTMRDLIEREVKNAVLVPRTESQEAE